MKTAVLIARILLGLMFTIFGLNGFLHFIPQKMPANPLAVQFFTAVSASHFSYTFFAVQLVGGLLLLSGFFVSLGLILLAAEITNILTYHITMDPGEIAPGLLALVLWLIVFAGYRRSFDGVLASKPALL